eukprot:11201209-Lingulodinium_polyedra.AAC.1
MAPEPKRRRFAQKEAPPSHLSDPAMTAVIPERLNSSRLSREMGVTIYSVKWENRSYKPLELRLWGGQGLGNDRPILLRALGGRENGE